MAKENTRDSYTLKNTELGEVRIADEVVAVIAGLAATEVEGVSSMSGNITNELVSRLGMKNLSKGVRLSIIDNTVTVQVSLILEYGYSVPDVCGKVQDRIKTAVENMTGLEVLEVNVQIAGVNIK